MSNRRSRNELYLDVLKALLKEPDGCGLLRLMHAANVNAATLKEILETLQSRGYIKRKEATRKTITGTAKAKRPRYHYEITALGIELTAKYNALYSELEKLSRETPQP